MGAFITAIRGKVAGSVFSRNSAGDTVRNKALRPRPKPRKKSLVNARWKFYMQEWRNLPASVQLDWNNYATNFTFRNKLGDIVPAHGNVVYATTSRFYYEVNNAMPFVTLPFITPPQVDEMGLIISLTGPTAKLILNPPLDDAYIVTYTSPPFTLGKKTQMLSRMTQIVPIENIPSATNTAIYFHDEFFAEYPWAKVGMYVWVAYRSVQINCFAWSPLKFQLVIITV